MNKTRSALIIVILLSSPFASLAQDAPPPPPGGGHGQTSNQGGGRAPLGSGLLILLGMGGIYGAAKAYKYYQTRKKCLLE